MSKILRSASSSAKAKAICEELTKAQALAGCYVQLPNIDPSWVWRWKKDKGVVLRTPNQRAKCSKPLLMSRLRAMWLNVNKVRHLASRFLGDDLRGAYLRDRREAFALQ